MAGMDVIVDGLHVTGSDEGKGPVALLLHGWNGDYKTVMSLKEVLPRHRIIAPDLPGFGGSQPPKEAWGVDGYAKMVLGLLDKLSVDKVDILVGHSFGGRICIELVGSGQLDPRRLILLGSHGLPEERKISSQVIGLASNLSKILPPQLRSAVGKRWRSEDYRQATGIMAPIFLKVIAQDATEAASAIKAKTLLVYGDDDDTTPPAMGYRFHDLIKGSQMEVVKDAKHYVHLDQPERVNQLIEEFIK